MMIAALPYRCWTITPDPDEEHPHWEFRADAVEYLTTELDPDSGFSVTQFPCPCWTVACLCGVAFGEDGEVAYHLDADHVEDEPATAGWVISDHVAVCPRCVCDHAWVYDPDTGTITCDLCASTDFLGRLTIKAGVV